MATRVRDLRLTTGRRVVDTAQITLANRARCSAAALRQVARCEAMLRAEPKDTPRWRRCPECDGLEDTTRPHQHAA